MMAQVGRHLQLGSSADQLAHALSLNRRQLAEVTDEHERKRRAQAIDQLAQYVGLLREATVAATPRYAFKLEFPDGRWNLAEKELAAAPRVGDLVQFSDGGRWRIRGSELVRPRPLGKPPRQFFVCAPAA